MRDNHSLAVKEFSGMIETQLLLIQTSWESLRMLEFKSFINKKIDGSNFLLSKFQLVNKLFSENIETWLLFWSIKTGINKKFFLTGKEGKIFFVSSKSNILFLLNETFKVR